MSDEIASSSNIDLAADLPRPPNEMEHKSFRWSAAWGNSYLHSVFPARKLEAQRAELCWQGEADSVAWSEP